MEKQETKENIKKIFSSNGTKKAIKIFGIIIIALFIFQAGVFVGFHKASFDRDWGENYSRNFGFTHRGGMMGGFSPENFPNAHGAVGKIIKITLPNIIVLDKDNTEKVVVINDDTEINKMHDVISKDQLALDDFVVVIGSPNSSGQIEAKFIRVLPMQLPTQNINEPNGASPNGSQN